MLGKKSLKYFFLFFSLFLAFVWRPLRTNLPTYGIDWYIPICAGINTISWHGTTVLAMVQWKGSARRKKRRRIRRGHGGKKKLEVRRWQRKGGEAAIGGGWGRRVLVQCRWWLWMGSKRVGGTSRLHELKRERERRAQVGLLIFFKKILIKKKNLDYCSVQAYSRAYTDRKTIFWKWPTRFTAVH